MDVEKERHDVCTDDGLNLVLTRFRGGPKGPVLLAHGVGVHSGMFQLSTVSKSFAPFLVEEGYDVWLLDWRGSTRLPLTQFTLDDAATYDFPAAVRGVRDVTRADSVQAVVHCAGSAALFMALSSGLLPDVRSVVASQVALHFDVPAATRIKSLLHLPDVLAKLDIASLSPGDAPEHPFLQEVLTQAVNAWHHECRSTVCHRLTFMYGHLYRHERLNQDTHDRLLEQFGPCNITAFRHLAELARERSSTKFDFGEEENRRHYGTPKPPSYLRPEPLRIPITFISGSKNETFLPSSTDHTYKWLCEKNGPRLYDRQVVADYGHLDTFMGFEAYRDTYPLFLKALEATAS